MNESIIASLEARETLSDYDTPSVEVTVVAANGARGVAAYAEGVSFGPYYGRSLLDGGVRFAGRGVRNAVTLINTVLAPALIGMDSRNQSVVDAVILGALSEAGVDTAVNVTSPASFAVLKAAAASLSLPLYRHIGGAFAAGIPVPGFLCASGGGRYGRHPGAFDRPNYAFVAYDFPCNDEAEYALWEVENRWENALSKEYGLRIQHNTAMAVPRGLVDTDERLWELMARCIREAGFENRVGLHADFSAGAFYDPERGRYEGLIEAGAKTGDEMLRRIVEIAGNHPFAVIQDPLMHLDLDGFAEITASVDIQVAGCDVFGADIDRLRRCIAGRCFNAAVLRPYRFATFSECAMAAALCNNANIGVMPRDSAGEDEDIVHYAVGLRCGSMCMSGLSSHGNRMGLVEMDIGPRLSFYGKSGLKGGRFAV